MASFRLRFPFFSFIGVLLRWGEVRPAEDVEGTRARLLGSGLIFSLIRNLSMEFLMGPLGFFGFGVLGGVEFSEWRINRIFARGFPLLLRSSPRDKTCKSLESVRSCAFTTCCTVGAGSIAGNKFLLGVLWRFARCRGDEGLGLPDGIGTRPE